MVNLGDVFPDFTADTTMGPIILHEWLGNSWGILFSHPADFTPVCTTELSRVVNLMPEFEKRNVKPIALSCDSVANHMDWISDIKLYSKSCVDEFPFPIISDKSRTLAVRLGMIDPDEKDQDGLPLTARAVFVIGPDKKMRLSILYPAIIGRNFDEILRAIDALQLTEAHKYVATPVDWQPGQVVMVQPSVKEEDYNKLFPKGITEVALPSGKKYLLKVPQPS